MKRPHKLILSALTLTLFFGYARPCSFPDDELIFVQRYGPDAPYDTFTKGRLGVILPTYRVRNLVVAYRYLAGTPLTPSEQDAANAVEKYYNSYGSDDSNPDPKTQRNVPGQDYQSFTNCLADAFENARKTIADRQKTYGPNNPEVLAWNEAQTAVFSNCAGPGTIPPPAPANASLWLKQDRAYQIAAANFYALNYDTAIAEFREIAADKASPWHTIAPYLVARAMLRRAFMSYQFGNSPTLPQMIEADDRIYDNLTEVEHQLDSIIANPALQSIHAAAGHLRDIVEARLHPTTQAAVLANRLSHPSSEADFRQNLIDLGFVQNIDAYQQALYRIRPESKFHTAPAPPAPPSSLNDWLAVVYDQPPNPFQRPQIAAPAKPATDAIARWQSTQQPTWLLAALTAAQPNDAAIPQLTAAARNIPATSPAYASITYQRLRLSASTNPLATYREVTALLPSIEKTQPRSTINLFASLHTQSAPTLAAFLHSVPRLPASNGDVDGGEGEPLPHDTTISSNGGTWTSNVIHVTVCGVDITTPTTPHFSQESSVILNQRTPLTLLREAALSNILPKNLNFALAEMAWTRAVLLNDTTTAAALTPLLSTCQPAFKPWLDRYNAAKTPTDRQAEGLLALMRFTSANPDLTERDFAAYLGRDGNWWCADQRGSDLEQDPHQLSVKDIRNPPFLTPAQIAEATTQQSQLYKQAPNAANYFASQTLAFVAANPKDPRNPDLLGFASRVMRSACRTDASAELNHQLFNALHRKYPNSEWTKRYRVWE
jgi:hypothetical protein